MAKASKSQPKATATRAKKLAGMKVAFIGKFGYLGMWLNELHSMVTHEGGSIVDAAQADPDYLIAGEGRGGKPPGDVAKLQKKYPATTALDIAGLSQLLLPTRQEILTELTSGRFAEERCRNLGFMTAWVGGTQFDLNGADLRGVNLYGLRVECLNLDAADLRSVKCQFTEFGTMASAKLDNLEGENAYFGNLSDCTFRKANLKKCWMLHGTAKIVTGCDFTGAEMSEGQLVRGKVTDCVFKNAALADAQFEGTEFSRCDFTKADLTRVHGSKVKFSACTFVGANLHKADLRLADLTGADFTGADLTGALLAGADLGGAKVDGADFAGAVLTDAKLDKTDMKKAKNYEAPKVLVAGPKLLALVAAVRGAPRFGTWVTAVIGDNKFAQLEIAYTPAVCHALNRADGLEFSEKIDAPNLERGILNLAARWPKGEVQLETVGVKGDTALDKQELLDLAADAWAEAFGAELVSPEALEKRRIEKRTRESEEDNEALGQLKKKGIKFWDALDGRIQYRLDFRGSDLSGANLKGIWVRFRDLKGANFAGANLSASTFSHNKLQMCDFTGTNFTRANISKSVCKGTVFQGANLSKADLSESKLTASNFQNANLTGADLEKAKLVGADFTGAILTEAKLDGAEYDETTKLPKGFKPPDTMIWKGKIKPIKAKAVGSLDFATFHRNIQKKIDGAKLDKAAAMLKSEKFQLFADVKPDSVVGIVKSQSNKDLVYSCRLAGDGNFSCCTQNLRHCGGLNGRLCKHLLVLVVGLTKAERLDPATVEHWIDASRSQKPSLDGDLMSETFLRYKGAEAGEVDWRPTETLPEDFYAM